jgi:hypothetical protein
MLGPSQVPPWPAGASDRDGIVSEPTCTIAGRARLFSGFPVLGGQWELLGLAATAPAVTGPKQIADGGRLAPAARVDPPGQPEAFSQRNGRDPPPNGVGNRLARPVNCRRHAPVPIFPGKTIRISLGSSHPPR